MSNTHCTPRVTPPISIKLIATEVRYTGTKENLIAAGAADESMFPQGRKRIACRCSIKLPPEVRFYTRRIKGGLFCIDRPKETKPPHLKPGPRLAVNDPSCLFANMSDAEWSWLQVFWRNGGGLWNINVCGVPVYYIMERPQS